MVIHWDGKVLKELTGSESVDRLPVLSTHMGNEQLLSVPKVGTHGNGLSIATAVYGVLLSWGIIDLVQAICFDTTATNTGIVQGAAAILENMLKRILLWLPCRHHIYEIILKAVFTLKVNPSSGPSVTIFDRFKDEWPNIDKKKYKSGMADSDVKHHINDAMAKEIMEFCFRQLYRQQPRDDYREFLELTIIFLGGDVPNTQSGTVRNFAPPGACGEARWMMKAIYSLKMYLFREQFKLSKYQLKGIRDVCIFTSTLYIKAWFGCRSAINAPKQDLDFIKSAINYATIDKTISDIVLKKIARHLWYLSGESVGLAFFDSSISVEEKKRMVKALKINSIESKRIEVSLNELKTYNAKNISDFVNANTRNFFDRFGISTDFLTADPSKWADREDYKDGLQICSQLQVVNDAAERAVQLFTKYNRFGTKNEEDMQYTLHVVRDYNEKHPSHTKKDLSKDF